MTASKWIAAFSALFLLTGCGDAGTGPLDPGGDGGVDAGGSATGDNAVPADPEPDPTAKTFCGRLGYRCTARDVDLQVMERSDALLDDLRARIEGGESNADVASWIAGQDGVADAWSSQRAIVFRLEGGEPTWFFTPPDAGIAPVPIEAPVYRSDVVGHETPRDNAEREKKALVLAPFLFSFGSGDPAPSIQTMLTGVRDYAGRVRYVPQTTAPGAPATGGATGSPTVEDFKGWDSYDVIVVSTHGLEMGEDSFGCSIFTGDLFCVTAVATGQRVAGCAAYIKAHYPDTPGVRCGGVENVVGTFLILDTDFFALEDGELDKAVVYMGGCQTYKNSSLAAELAGSRSEYFGWSETVLVAEMGAPARRLFQLMIRDGLTTADAYHQLESEGGTSTTLATLKHFSNGDGLHIREITRFKNPMDPAVSGGAPPNPWGGPGDELSGKKQWSSPGADLEAGDFLPFLGTPDDGKDDELFVYVDVDGVEPGAESDYDVTVEVDGTQFGTWSLDGDEARRVDDYTMRLRVRGPLGFDVHAPQIIALKATTHLPGDDDAESHDEISVQLANPTLHLTSTIESTSQDVHVLSEVEGDVGLLFEPGDTPDELKVGLSTGTVRYVSFDASLPTAPGCTREISTVDGRLGIREADVGFQDAESADFGVPDELVLIVYPEIDEVVSLSCATGPLTIHMRHWFSGFWLFHTGYFDGMNELDEERAGFVLEDWTAGSGEVFASKSYARSGTDEDVAYREETTIQIRGPAYVAAAAPLSLGPS